MKDLRFLSVLIGFVLTFAIIPNAFASEASDPTEETEPLPIYYYTDYRGLAEQIAIANGLKEEDYTKESWAIFQNVLTSAKAVLYIYGQEMVDIREAELKNAISQLVKMDYAGLTEAIVDVKETTEENVLYDLWTKLVEAVAKGKSLLNSGDQVAVDSVAAEITEIMEQLQTEMDALDNPEIVTKEVKIEVPPTSDFCNIAMHQTWPVLFFISLTLNCALFPAVIILLRKKKNQTDNMPLVDYDIDDDY